MLAARDMQIVIPSRRRVQSCRTTANLLPSAKICVAEEEADDYHEFGDRLVTHPDDVTGIGPVRRWCLDNFDAPTLVLIGDDVERVYCLVGRRPRQIKDPEAIWQVIYQAASVAHELNITCFAFAMTADIRKFFPYQPFGLNKCAGPCLGFNGRNVVADPRLARYTDVDINLACLLKDRFCWQDCRFAFTHSFQNNVGGATHVHTVEHSQRDLATLASKWGPPGPDRLWDVVESQGRTRTIIKVKRRQQIKQ